MYRLRLIGREDAELIRRARNSDMVRPFMCGQEVIDVPQHMAWFGKKLAVLGDEPYCLFLYHGTPIGVVGISVYDAEHGIGEWGFYLFAPDAPRGAGTAMLVAFCEYVMQHTRIRALSARVKADNRKSLHLHEKLGFARLQQEDGIVHFLLMRECWQRERQRFAPLLGEGV